MVDRIEREIEEILAKLDDGPTPPAADGRAPISIQSRRKKSPSGPSGVSRARKSLASSLPDINPATLLFTGAGLLVAGLILSVFMSALIWVSFAGIVIFLSAFAWSFIRTPSSGSGDGAGRTPSPSAHYWRDRYISYEPQNPSPLTKIKRRFRK